MESLQFVSAVSCFLCGKVKQQAGLDEVGEEVEQDEEYEDQAGQICLSCGRYYHLDCMLLVAPEGFECENMCHWCLAGVHAGKQTASSAFDIRGFPKHVQRLEEKVKECFNDL